MTHVELLDLNRLPQHLIVLGGGYAGLELAQAMRRFGARVTVIEQGPKLAAREDPDIGAALLDLFAEEGITVHIQAQVHKVEGESGTAVRVITDAPDGETRTHARRRGGTALQRLGEGRWPAPSVVTSLFGTWAAARAAAFGAPPGRRDSAAQAS